MMALLLKGFPVMYVGNNKAVAYAREDKLGTKIDDFSHYCTVLMSFQRQAHLSHTGQRLAYSAGVSHRVCLRQS